MVLQVEVLSGIFRDRNVHGPAQKVKLVHLGISAWFLLSGKYQHNQIKVGWCILYQAIGDSVCDSGADQSLMTFSLFSKSDVASHN